MGKGSIFFKSREIDLPSSNFRLMSIKTTFGFTSGRLSKKPSSFLIGQCPEADR
jgi:hypothetical protein